MVKKPSQESEASKQQKALEERVDEMMDIKRPTGDVSDVAASVNESLAKNLAVDEPATKIKVKTGKDAKNSKTPSTAPELPANLKEPKEMAIPATEPDLPKPKTETESAEPEIETEPDDDESDVDLDDSQIAAAVDDIVAHEGDTALAVDDAKAARRNKTAPTSSWKDKLRRLVKSKWTWLSLVGLLTLLLAVPASRYTVLGLVIKKPVTITVIDSKTANPVSNATVELGGTSTKTDANGKAQVNASLGERNLTVNKQYYRELQTTYFVGFKAAPVSFRMTATGRLVPMAVINKVTGQPLSNVQIKVLDTTARTNAKGLAFIALPTTSDKNNGRLALNGYNASQVEVKVTDQVDKANSFELTPAGRVYFLSNRSGKLDVIKANLDGTDRKTVLEGTGRENRNSTSLLASRDWRYLVLKSQREDRPALYLIDTTSDKVTQFDSGEGEINLLGWYNHAFVYTTLKTDAPEWQTGRLALKSYNAEQKQLNQLDQTQAEGDENGYAAQTFLNFYILNSGIVYNILWSGSDSHLGGKNDTIRAVQPGGQTKQDYQNFVATDTNFIEAALYKPQEIYFAVHHNNGGKAYYEFANQTAKAAILADSNFSQGYPTFLLSPSGNKTLWSEPVDGKSTFFVGNANAENNKKLADLSDYTAYGWHGEAYALVAKGGSELFIMSTNGLSAGRQPLKIADYYRPAQTYSGYGYGYGGL